MLNANAQQILCSPHPDPDESGGGLGEAIKKAVRSKDQTATSNRIVNYAIKKMSRYITNCITSAKTIVFFIRDRFTS